MKLENMKHMLSKGVARVAGVMGAVALLLVMSGAAHAEVPGETQYIFNTFSFLVHGFLVMWMAAGFAMLEAGLVRTKNTAMQCLKNIALFSIASIMYYLIGYNLMYDGVDGGFMGSISLWGQDDSAAAAGKFVGDGAVGYSAASDFSSSWCSSRRPLRSFPVRSPNASSCGPSWSSRLF
jgi:Amt family ammonium transporter